MGSEERNGALASDVHARLHRIKSLATTLSKLRVEVAKIEAEESRIRVELEENREWALGQPGAFSGDKRSDAAIVLRVIREALA